MRIKPLISHFFIVLPASCALIAAYVHGQSPSEVHLLVTELASLLDRGADIPIELLESIDSEKTELPSCHFNSEELLAQLVQSGLESEGAESVDVSDSWALVTRRLSLIDKPLSLDLPGGNRMPLLMLSEGEELPRPPSGTVGTVLTLDCYLAEPFYLLEFMILRIQSSPQLGGPKPKAYGWAALLKMENSTFRNLW